MAKTLNFTCPGCKGRANWTWTSGQKWRTTVTNLESFLQIFTLPLGLKRDDLIANRLNPRLFENEWNTRLYSENKFIRVVSWRDLGCLKARKLIRNEPIMPTNKVGFIVLFCVMVAVLPKLKSLITRCRECDEIDNEPTSYELDTMLLGWRYHKQQGWVSY